ncbi:hypothetical protein ACSQ67_008357 [Phaseolus vulgaris]
METWTRLLELTQKLRHTKKVETCQHVHWHFSEFTDIPNIALATQPRFLSSIYNLCRHFFHISFSGGSFISAVVKGLKLVLADW